MQIDTPEAHGERDKHRNENDLHTKEEENHLTRAVHDDSDQMQLANHSDDLNGTRDHQEDTDRLDHQLDFVRDGQVGEPGELRPPLWRQHSRRSVHLIDACGELVKEAKALQHYESDVGSVLCRKLHRQGLPADLIRVVTQHKEYLQDEEQSEDFEPQQTIVTQELVEGRVLHRTHVDARRIDLPLR